MDVELVNPFIEATLHVLRTMSSTEATPGKPYVKKDQHARGDVTGVIGLTGEASGTISVSFTEDSIIAI
ncbi:MAG: chemotaxis protein CheX, partial [Deltaproteobacteria bacterium]